MSRRFLLQQIHNFLLTFILFPYRKLFTAVATVGVGIQAMFFSDYDIEGFEGQEHIFTNIQKDTRKWVDQNVYGIDTNALPDSSTTNQAAPSNGNETVNRQLSKSNKS